MKAYDRFENRHICQDETATVVNGQWLCKCPGGPFNTNCDKSPCEGGAPESQEEVTSGSGFAERWEVMNECTGNTTK